MSANPSYWAMPSRTTHLPEMTAMPRTLARLAALAGLALGLAGCGQLPVRSDAASATPGVTVYGTADVGWGRVGR